MKRPLVILGALVLLTATVHAEDAPSASPPAPAPASPPKPPPPPTPEQAADAVLAAVAAKDDAALKVLAAKDGPDPWLVADELVRRGEFDVADAFARAAPRVDTEALPAYVASRRGVPDDPARRTRLAAGNVAAKERRLKEALDAFSPEEASGGGDVVGVRLAFGRGSVLATLGRRGEASSAFLEAAASAERLGWLARATQAYHRGAQEAAEGASLTAALEGHTRALALAERRGDTVEVARALGNLGRIQSTLGDHASALASHERALKLREALGDAANAAVELGNVGIALLELGDFTRALEVLERALAAKEALGNRASAARTLVNIGWAYHELGDSELALSTLRRAVAIHEAVGDTIAATATLHDIGVMHVALGDYATALGVYERVLAAQEARGDRRGAAMTLGNLANVYYHLGDFARALALHERALAETEALGDSVGAAMTLGNLGVVRYAFDDFAGALANYERALAAQERLGDKRGAARTLGNIANAQRALGDVSKALETHERALEAKRALGDRSGEASTLGNLGSVYHELGDLRKAVEFHERALGMFETLGRREQVATFLTNLGNDHLRLGDPVAAMAFARRAAVVISTLTRGLGAEEGAGAREPAALTFDVGADAAVVARDPAELAYFLESGRAGALLEGLSARTTLMSVAVSAELRRAEATARRAEAAATAALRAALERGDRPTVRARREEFDAATERVSTVIARIQREAKAGAALVYPEVASLAALQSTLLEGDALVLYALQHKLATALVVTRGEVRIAPLGTSQAVEAAVAAIAFDEADVDVTAPLAALRALVIDPLALAATTKRLLVSPVGALAYVPFAALAPDRTVAYVPSGTTYRLLREEGGARGEGVLALGDPEYTTKVDERALAVHRGAMGRLTPLPATRAEVNAVGTVTLLGAAATETGFQTALAARPRWRAVHLACHGLVDPERPGRSSLAITAAGDDDGFLTCLDVFRLRIPADLVVLSACETGKGRIVKGEGIVGLTRAFMFAGSPRVICSLWKVDDEATRALMTKFYELWNPRAQPEDPERAKRVEGAPGPGLPPAEALRQAQAFVRAQEQWKHPYYWAAWVLWGLPD